VSKTRAGGNLGPRVRSTIVLDDSEVIDIKAVAVMRDTLANKRQRKAAEKEKVPGKQAQSRALSQSKRHRRAETRDITHATALDYDPIDEIIKERDPYEFALEIDAKLRAMDRTDDDKEIDISKVTVDLENQETTQKQSNAGGK